MLWLAPERDIKEAEIKLVEGFYCFDSDNVRRFKSRKRLFAGTLPANKKLFAGTLPAFKKLFAGTLPAFEK